MRYLALGLLLMPFPALAKNMPIIPEFKEATSPRLNAAGDAFLAPGQKSEDIQKVDRSIIWKTGGRWPDPSKISVCWMNPEAHGEIPGDLEKWITTDFKRAGIGFVWSGKCAGIKKNQIRVYLKPTHTWSGNGQMWAGGGLSWLGPVSDPLGGSEGQGTLNVQVSKDVVGYGTSGYRDWIISSTRETTVHEFGHALGLAHEQERSDAPICQDQRGTLPDGGNYVFVGKYDPNSVMNYCRTGGTGTGLSEGDIVGLNTLYPRPTTTTTPEICQEPVVVTPPAPVAQPPGSYIVKVRSSMRCLDLIEGLSYSGVQITAKECAGTRSQAWTYKEFNTGTFELRDVDKNLCMDVAGGSKLDGARIQLYSCNSTSSQRFSFLERGNGWQGLKNESSGKCLQFDGRTGFLTQQACANVATQSMGFFESVGAVGSRPKVMQ